jgi:hypothetical protein
MALVLGAESAGPVFWLSQQSNLLASQSTPTKPISAPQAPMYHISSAEMLYFFQANNGDRIPKNGEGGYGS